MSGSVNNDAVVADYKAGRSLPQVASMYTMPISRARRIIMDAGVLRSRTEAIRLASQEGRLGSAFRGKTRTFSDEHKSKIGASRRKWGEKHAAGISTRTNGFVVHTRGQNKHRGVHVTVMEERLGRHLLADEHVHHIDGDRTNNDPNNLALVTIAGHARLHRREDALVGKKRERKSNGRFS